MVWSRTLTFASEALPDQKPRVSPCPVHPSNHQFWCRYGLRSYDTCLASTKSQSIEVSASLLPHQMQAEARRSQKGPRWRNTVLIMTICLAFGRRVSGYVNGFVPVCFSREVAASSSILSEVPRFRRVKSREAKMYSLSMSASASSDSSCDASSNNLKQN